MHRNLKEIYVHEFGFCIGLLLSENRQQPTLTVSETVISNKERDIKVIKVNFN
jgi:hypothetical protein